VGKGWMYGVGGTERTSLLVSRNLMCVAISSYCTMAGLAGRGRFTANSKRRWKDEHEWGRV
jgi:hypothetical protein